MHMVRKLAVLSAVVALLVGLVPAGASAHFFGLRKMDDNWVDFASDEDNTDHYLFWNHFVHFQQIDQYQARTDLTVAEQPRWGWNNGTDVVWFAYPLGTGLNADEVCRAVRLNGTCDRARVRFGEHLTRAIPGAAGFFLACHEFGHAYGFEHLSDGCMHNPVNPQSPPNDGTLSSHMIGHINAQY
jgi:hypothetical protein